MPRVLFVNPRLRPQLVERRREALEPRTLGRDIHLDAPMVTNDLKEEPGILWTPGIQHEPYSPPGTVPLEVCPPLPRGDRLVVATGLIHNGRVILVIRRPIPCVGEPSGGLRNPSPFGARVGG